MSGKKWKNLIIAPISNGNNKYLHKVDTALTNNTI